MIPMAWATGLSMSLFAIGILGLMLQKSALRILVAVELVLNAASLNFIAGSHLHQNGDGLVFTLFNIALAAAEAAVGLGILIHSYRHVRSVDVTKSTMLRW